MPTYIILAKYTDQAAKEIKEIPGRLPEVVKTIEAYGGKMLASYSVMGEYDRVSIFEAPDDEAAMAFLMKLNSRGNVRTTTLRAFTPEEMANIAKKFRDL